MMKNRFSVVGLSSFVGLAISLLAGLSLFNSKKSAESAEAIGNYSTNASTYYSGITATSGQALAGQLHDLITTTHKYYTSYADNGANGYQKYTDQYYENGSKVNNYIYEFYSGVKWPAAWDPDSGSTSGGYNREHCWCQSNSVNSSGTQMWGETGGGADMHHLRPVEARLNSTRSNNEYGEISNRDSYKVYAKYGSNTTYALGGYNSGGTFEPLDSKKGDVARIILYVYLHYNSYTVTSVFGSGNATTNGSGSSSYFSSSLLSLTKITNQNTEAKALEMLLEWNASDAVDEIEQRRNEQVATYQGNRNPFIDNSNYAEMIWGTGSSNPTVNSVSVSPSSLSLDLNGTTTGNLTATVTVTNGAAQTVNWTSSNTNVATVSSSGVVTAKAKGSCIITATSTVNANKSASCSISVSDSSGGGGGSGESTTITTNIGTYASDHSWSNNTKYTSISLDAVATASVGTGGSNTGKYYTSGNQWRFYQTENATIVISVVSGYELDSVTFTFGIENTAVLKDSSSNTVSSGSAQSVSGSSVTFSVGNSGSATNGQIRFTQISVTYHSTSSGSSAALSSISLNTSNVETSFYVGQSFDYSGLVVTAHYEDGTEDIVAPASVSTPTMLSAGTETVTVTYAENNVTKTATYTITVVEVSLSSIEINDVKYAYTIGDTFEEPTVYANYSNNSSVDVTSSATFTGYDMSSTGNQTVTVSFGGKSLSYQISVIEDTEITDDTQYSLINSVNDLEIGKSYIITNGTTGTVKAAAVTSNTNNRKATSVTISDDKITRGSSVMSFTLGGSSGAYTFATENYAGTDGYLASNGDNNHLKVVNSAGTATISFSDDAAIINIGPSTSRTLICFNSTIDSNNGGFACYGAQGSYGHVYLWKQTASKVLSSISLNTLNVQTTFSIGDTFNYSGLVVTASYDDSTSAVVSPTSVSSPDMSSAGNKTVTVTYTEGGVTKTSEYSITVNSNPSISWTSPTIQEYSGALLTGTDVNDWSVTYNDGAGHFTVLTYNQLTIKLGGTIISLPYTWMAADNGKTLTATYSGLTTSESESVDIIQTVNIVNAPKTSAWDYTFESKQWSAATSVTLSDKSWTMSGTDDGTPFFGYDSTKGQQFGSGTHPFSDVSLQSSGFSGTIDSVTVYTSGANSINATVQVSVGGTAYGSAKTITNANAAYTFDLGGKSGTVSIDYVNSSSKAIYIKEIVVNTVSGSENIANSEDHMNAQKVAVKFAKAFNAAMDETGYCTENLSSAWSQCSSAYTTFLSEAAALGSAEETYAKNLIKYATAQYSDDSGDACIERMRKTYEICVSKHGQTAFMSDLVTVSPANNVVLFSNITSNKNVIVIIIVSLISVTTIGGYFFIRRRKPE